MIPKTIHYCWFSGEKPNRFIRNCLKTWQKTMPDYRLRCWDASSFDFESIPFVKEAWDAKNWAYVADYIRLYALYTEGGIYLDSDVKTYRRFDSFLDNRMFMGTELPHDDGKIHVEPAIMGAEKGHPYIKMVLEYYNSIHYLKANGQREDVIPFIMTNILKEHYKYIDSNLTQNLSDGIKIYSQEYFGHKFGTHKGEYYAIHFYNGAWSIKHRGKIYRFFKDNDLMHIYIKLEKIIQKWL